jgi:hypothetical protein
MSTTSLMQCPACRQPLSVPHALTGVATCPHCKAQFVARLEQDPSNPTVRDTTSDALPSVRVHANTSASEKKQRPRSRVSRNYFLFVIGAVLFLCCCFAYFTLSKSVKSAKRFEFRTARKSDQNPTSRSWNIILREEEIPGAIDEKRSHDYEIDEESHDSTSLHKFISVDGNWNVEVELFLYNSDEIASSHFFMTFENKFERFITVDKKPSTLKGYRPRTPPESHVEKNPFFSRKIELDTIGDESGCYQWNEFSPNIVSRVGRVYFVVSCTPRGKTSLDGRDSVESVSRSVEIAKAQVTKIRRTLYNRR